MSWLGRFLSKDPAELLAQAQRSIAAGDPVRALELARGLDRARDMALRSQAVSVLQQARDAVVSRALANATAAERAGDPADAADWIRAALQHVGEGGIQRAELEGRLEALESRVADTPPPNLLGRTEVELPAAPDLDLDTRYEMLVGMLTEEVARRYEDRPPGFREALVELNEGRADTALARLEEQAARAPGDPVLLLERGRARLMTGKWASAREDLEAAWTRLGDDPLDLAGSVSVPLLWAEAVLAAGDPGAVLDRLREPAEPEAGNPDLSALYVQALLDAERGDEARDWLAALCEEYPERPDFPHGLAGVLAEQGDAALAIRVLERAVAPSCASGSCSRPPLHLPSLRLLATLHLAADGPLPRLEELLAWIAHAQGGSLAAEDHRLVARMHEREGDPRAAQQARLRAEEMEREARSGGETSPADPVGSLSSGRSVL